MAGNYARYRTPCDICGREVRTPRKSAVHHVCCKCRGKHGKRLGEVLAAKVAAAGGGS